MSGEGRDEVNARLAAIVATSDDAIISKDLNGIIQSWNDAATRIFGYEPHEMIGQPLLKLIPSDRTAEEADILRRIRDRERVDHYQTVRQRKDGRLIEISVTISPIIDSTGKVIGASKIARDITQAKRVERERERMYELLRRMASLRDLRSLLQEITDAATELSNAQFGAFFYNVVDRRGESYMLYTISGVPAEHFSKFPMPRNTAVFAPTFAGHGVVRSDDITNDPRYGKSAPHHGMPEGHLPVRSYLAVPVLAPEGAVLGGLFFGHEKTGIFDDHAERVVSAIANNASIALENARLHREVTENAAQFQQLANTIPQLAWMADRNGTVYWANDRWHEFTGIARNGSVDAAWRGSIDPDESTRVLESWHRAVTKAERWEETFAIRGSDGALRWHLSRAMPLLDEGGGVSSWFGTHTDVTEQRALMQEREALLAHERSARAEAERVGRMKDEFLATLSHELRTPLNAILGWSHIVRRSRGDAGTLEEGLAVIERNARTQSQLIEDLLDMSRIVSGKLRLDVQRVDVSAAVMRAVEVLKPMVEAKQISLRTFLDPSAGPINGDPSRLQQVVWNLLSNAIKFTQRGGKVELVVARVNSHVEMTIADNGIGIEPHFLPHVFERFRQSDSSSTRQHSGLGLGLAIVKQLVELHGGQIDVHSQGAGKGSTFVVSLPLAISRGDSTMPREHPLSPTSAGEQAQISLDKVRVLVVDDEKDSRELIQRLLAERGAEVAVSADADSAVQALQSFRPDIILSDIGMPMKDGYQFIRDVRALPVEKGGRTLAVALTAFARSEDRTRAMMAGYQYHMPKPIDPHELVVTVAGLVDRVRQVE